MSDTRIVSLVPSLTELLFALGLGPQIVGRTGFCIHPGDQVRDVPKVGGTKTIDIDRIRALAPTHLVVNREENPLAPVTELARIVPNIVTTEVITLDENRQLYRQLGGVFGVESAAEKLVAAFDDGQARLKSRDDAGLRVLYLIWREPWMAVTSDTFISHMLAQVGLHTVPDTRDLGPPATDAERYPILTEQQISDLAPDLVLLSSEPYRFRESHFVEIAEINGLNATPCRLIDGEMTSWYGPRAINGLNYLNDFRDQLALPPMDKRQ